MAGPALTLALQNNLFFEEIIKDFPEGLFIIDADGVIRYFNGAMRRMTGWSPEEVVGRRDCLSLFKCRSEEGEPVKWTARPDPLRCPGCAALHRPERESRSDIYLRTKEGRKIAVAASYASFPVGRGYAVGVMREVTERRRRERKLKTQASTDELTGLFNYRRFRQTLASEIKRARRYGRPLSLVMIDIDHFKNYNDRHGHLQGNRILRQMARVIQIHTRETNVVARFGGEEFVILLPETRKEVALQAAHRLEEMIRKTDFPFQESQPGGELTVSMGVASFPEEAKTGEGLILAADSFLYRAKREGRHRVAG